MWDNFADEHAAMESKPANQRLFKRLILRIQCVARNLML
jgi:hypothetical protein